MKRGAAAVFLAALVGLSGVGLVACNGKDGLGGEEQVVKTDEEQIEARIAQFCNEYNGGSFEGVLGCMTAKTGNTMRALFNLLGGIAGGKLGVDISLSDMFSLGVGIKEGDFIGVTVERIVLLDGNNAIAAAKMNLAGGNAQTVYFEMLKENGSWLINDITDTNKLPVEGLGEGGVSVSEVRSNSILYSFEGTTYQGFVNARGEIFYHNHPQLTSYYTAVGEGTSYIEEQKTATWSDYQLFNAQGEKTATYTSEDFDEILGYGGGRLLVYKDTSTVSLEEHCYGVIDVASGGWQKPLTPSNELPFKGGVSGWEKARYCGEGIWAYYDYYGNSEHYTFYNASANTTFALEDCSLANLSFINGVLYGSNSWNGKIYLPHDNTEGESLPEYFILRSNGQVTEIEEFKGGICGEVLVDTSNEYITLKNLKKNTTATYTSFPKEKLSGYLSYGSYILLIIDGADGKRYTTVINDQAEEQFAPKQVAIGVNIWSGSYTDLYFSEGRIVYRANENSFAVMDLQGNTLVAENVYSKIRGYENGYAYAKGEAGICLLGLDGKPLTFKMPQ